MTWANYKSLVHLIPYKNSKRVTPKRLQKNPKKVTKEKGIKEKSDFSQFQNQPSSKIKHVHLFPNLKTIGPN
jgi:hypothetical protein